MPGFVPAKALPRETASLAAAIQPLEHQPPDRVVNLPQGEVVVRHAEVVDMPTHLAGNRPPEVGQRTLVALLTQLLVDGYQGAA
jgi:hypothetical protein